MSREAEVGGLNRLTEEQIRALDDTKKSREQWNKYRSDYLTLRKKLETLPDKLTHDVMVPFGPLAFMPGKMVHSNEIMVLLGDDWFAERSAKQACEIVDRRVKAIDAQTKDLEEQWKLLDSRRDFTDTFLEAAGGRGDFMEIKEDYDEKREKAWRESHRLRMKEEKKKMRVIASCKDDATTVAASVKAAGTTETDTVKDAVKDTVEDEDEDEEAALMRRLDELEILEQIQEYEEERARARSEEATNLEEPIEPGFESSSDEEESEESESESESEEEGGVAQHVINFSHTSVQETDTTQTKPSAITSTPHAVIQSPGDIIKLFPPKPRSILKSSHSMDSGLSKTLPHVRFDETVESQSKTDRKETKTDRKGAKSAKFDSKDDDENESEMESEAKVAFSGEVKERNVKVFELPEQNQKSTKPVSKFKQMRMQQQQR